MIGNYKAPLGSLVVAFLILSALTAVPETQGKTVTDMIQQKEMIKNQFLEIYDRLADKNIITVESQQNLDFAGDLEKLFDEEGFLEYIVSDEALQLVNENYYAIVSDPLYLDFYNSEPVQEFVQSSEFIDFMNSDEVQYILDNFNSECNNPNTESLQSSLEFFYVHEVNVNGEIEPLNFEQQSYELESCEIGSITWEPGLIIFLVFYFLFIDIISWIPAIIAAIVYFPAVWFSLYEAIIQLFPLPTLVLISTFVYTLVLFLIVVVFWPLIGWIVLLNLPPQDP